MDDIEDKFLDYVGYHWTWPKHAINPLDMGVVAGYPKKSSSPNRLSSKKRLLRPRKLIVLNKGKCIVDSTPSPDRQYVFISWVWSAFSTKGVDGNDDGSGLEKACFIAEDMTVKAGLDAYWLDKKCNALDTEHELLTADVNRMCDIIRGSKSLRYFFPTRLALESKNGASAYGLYQKDCSLLEILISALGWEKAIIESKSEAK